MCIFEPVWKKKIPNKCKLVHTIVVFKVTKDLCRTIIPLWKKNNSKKSSKAQNYHDTHAHDERTQTSDHTCQQCGGVSLRIL